MGEILVRNLEDSLIERLKKRAPKANASLEQTVRDLLAEAAKPGREEAVAAMDSIRERIRTRHGGDIDCGITAAVRADRVCR